VRRDIVFAVAAFFFLALRFSTHGENNGQNRLDQVVLSDSFRFALKISSVNVSNKMFKIQSNFREYFSVLNGHVFNAVVLAPI